MSVMSAATGDSRSAGGMLTRRRRSRSCEPPVVEVAQRNGGHGAELRGTDQRKVLRNVEQGGVGDRGESGGE